MKVKNIFLLNKVLIAIALLFTQQISFAQWTSNGPFGGSVKVLLVADTTLYAGTFEGGVYRSSSSQAFSWHYANYDGLTSGRINALAAADNFVFAGTADAGIFVTSNLGATWDSVNTGLTNRRILSMTTSGSTILAGTDGSGVFFSTNDGASWSASNSGLSNLTVTALAVTSSGGIFAGTSGGGVFVSFDSGVSWTAINTGLDNLNIKALAVAGTMLVAGTDNGIFSADILNPSWASAGLTNVIINSLTTIGTTVYVGTNAGVFTSPVDALAWTPANIGYTGSVNAVAVFNNKLIAGTQEDGIIKSNSLSAVSWVKTNTGLNNLKTFALLNKKLLVVVATNKGLYLSTDLAANYAPSNRGLTDSLHVTSLAFIYSKLYAATQFGGVFMSADTGKTWAAINTGLTSLSITHLAATNQRLLAATTNGEVFMKLHSGLNWTATTGLPAGLEITAMASEGQHTCVGTNGMGTFTTTNSSSPWVWVAHGLNNIQVTSMVEDIAGVYASTAGNGLFSSDLPDGGWEPDYHSNSLPTLHLLSVAIAYPSTGPNFPKVIVGYKGGVYYSQGSHWSPPKHLFYIPLYAEVQVISSNSTRVFIATANNSVYSTIVDDDFPVDVQDLARDGARLLLSPNPSHGQFQLDLQNVEAAIREVAVYDQLGRLVERFVYENGPTSWSISMQRPPGIYAVCVRTARGQVTQKIVIE